MPCIKIEHGFICMPNVYEYDGFIFEVHSYFGPSPLRRKDLDPFKNFPSEKHRFWDTWNKFRKLTKEEQERFEYDHGN